MRVILADDHLILRRGLALLLAAHPDVVLVAEVANGLEAISETERLRPDVVIMDLAMPRLDGIEATRVIRRKFPAVKVLMLTAFGDATAVSQAMAAGASGFVVKRSDMEEFVLALRLVMTGNTYFSRELAESLDVAEITQVAKSYGKSKTDLTPREHEVLQLIAEGHTMKSVGQLLSISPKTAEGHNSRIMTKVGAKNRADLVRFAIGAGLVRFDALGGRPGSQFPTTAAPSAEEQSSRSESGAGDDKRRAS